MRMEQIFSLDRWAVHVDYAEHVSKVTRMKESQLCTPPQPDLSLNVCYSVEDFQELDAGATDNSLRRVHGW